jgi:hypothetical protein
METDPSAREREREEVERRTKWNGMRWDEKTRPVDGVERSGKERNKMTPDRERYPRLRTIDGRDGRKLDVRDLFVEGF